MANDSGAGRAGPAPFEGAALHALTLPDMAALAFALLEEGASDAGSPLRKPALATLSAAGAPAVRTVILRNFDRQARMLELFTDARSAKVAELAREPRASMMFYDPRRDVQLRLTGKAVPLTGPAAEAAWTAAGLPSRRAYLAVAAPGTASDSPTSGLPPEVEGMIPSADRLEEGRVNFALIRFGFDEADLVVLSRSGHRRARIRWPADVQTVEWLVP
ncbi:pyridoxamine 5'-phosphate oxidase family protein [Parvibaculum sp.]|uniref:pyridoxamine 5'-phosphate oxidase family protein n=1 Tax=Parvibaculum sp. TaxID=2024848 RepID=UPI00262CBB40|nr:pyridoxamine 5'-phosphate oxidase family protein [Parvibaculum sp.]MCW5728418.1 pyridoxamine 5'-phosphate oxidase family protein [Parvibaculum sp.]